jgi:hypothetical protein
MCGEGHLGGLVGPPRTRVIRSRAAGGLAYAATREVGYGRQPARPLGQRQGAGRAGLRCRHSGRARRREHWPAAPPMPLMPLMPPMLLMLLMPPTIPGPRRSSGRSGKRRGGAVVAAPWPTAHVNVWLPTIPRCNTPLL